METTQLLAHRIPEHGVAGSNPVIRAVFTEAAFPGSLFSFVLRGIYQTFLGFWAKELPGLAAHTHLCYGSPLMAAFYLSVPTIDPQMRWTVHTPACSGRTLSLQSSTGL